MVELIYYTKIEEKTDVPPNFPVYAYSLIPFPELPNYVGGDSDFFFIWLLAVTFFFFSKIAPLRQKFTVLAPSRARKHLKLTRGLHAVGEVPSSTA